MSRSQVKDPLFEAHKLLLRWGQKRLKQLEADDETADAGDQAARRGSRSADTVIEQDARRAQA